MTRHTPRPKRDLPKPWTPKKYRPPQPALVTDHALVRYMERVMQIDVERLRNTLLDGRAELIRTIGTGHLHTSEGATLVVLDGKVVSVLRTDELKQGARVHRSTPA
jgi:hypothetical protein